MLTTLGDKYRIVRELGAGGMGAVHEAVHLRTGRHVAVKTLRGGALFDAAALARFQREARAVGAIDTKHIVQVLDGGFDDASGQHYMVMELLAGEDLAHLMDRVGPLPRDAALRIAAQAAAGLVKAHEAGVVHRDIKPANIFLAHQEGGEIVVKLLDFGIAKTTDRLADVESAALTRTGSMIGTPLYMSPEQAKGLRSIDHRTDVWSLGAVLFQMLTGRSPHHSVEHTMGQLIVAIVTEEPRSPREIAPWIDPEVATVVTRALQLDPGARFATARAMLEALRGCLPDGMDLRPEALVGVPTDQRAMAPRAVVYSTETPPSRRSIEEAGVASTTWQGTTSGSALVGDAAARRRRRGIVAGGVAIAAAVAAIGVASIGRRGTAVPVPIGSAAATMPLTSARPVLLAVPEGATVEVDGARAEVSGGAVEIRGEPGSTHRVTVRLGELRVTESVVIAKEGAFPPRIDLAPTAARATAAPIAGAGGQGAPARPRPVESAAASPRPAPPKAAAPAAVPAHATTFE